MTEGVGRGWRGARAVEDRKGVGRGRGDRVVMMDGPGTCAGGAVTGADDVGGDGRGFPACCVFRGA